MIKIALITIIDSNNYGNRLQNFAIQEYLKKYQIFIDTVLNYRWSNNKHNIVQRLKKCLISLKKKIKHENRNLPRFENFSLFNDQINFTNFIANINNYRRILNNYDVCIVGSDQVWNPSGGGYRDLSDIELLKNVKTNCIAFSASFGVNDIPDKLKPKVAKELSKFKAISVREDRGKEIVEELTGRKDVEVLVDPTMLLTAEEWDKVSKKPKMLKTDKYILNYFLGDLSDERRKEIDRVAKENNCEVINILDKNSPFYECGPSEFLYLEKNAFLICTDSFHSCVFAILYNTPFLVFDREQKNLVSMNSRLDTLLSKFKLENRRCNGKITKKDLTCDYKEACKILEKERIKADKFLRKALNIKDSD